MKTNAQKHCPVFTHEGGPSSNLPPLLALKRSVMACMLWEDNFYENGQQVVDRIGELAAKVPAHNLIALARETHDKGLLRHVPLKLIVEILKKPPQSRARKEGEESPVDLIARVCSRPDQMTELLSLYWKDGKKPLAAQLKKGLAKAFTQFDEYQLAKWDKEAPIRLRDVLFLCHAKPKDEAQADLWKRLISKNMKTPDTWETRLSAGEDKKESFTELLQQGKMGKLAILRNLRNMHEQKVDYLLVNDQLKKKGRPILPFQFIAAARSCPAWEELVDKAMIQSLEGKEKLPGVTVVFVDVSGSMEGNKISAKSEISCMDAASGLAILLRETCEVVEFFSFSVALALVPPRRGMALRDAIVNSQPHSSTMLGASLDMFNDCRSGMRVDRLIVITDEQVADILPKMKVEKAYILNISTCKNGIKNSPQWTTISGFSEASIDFIREAEQLEKSE